MDRHQGDRMAQQIIRQPDGLFAIFSDTSGTIEVWDATAEEVEDLFVKEAVEKARATVRRAVAQVGKGNAPTVYGRWTMTWTEALEADRESGGEASREKG